ncbi:hypothetical protein ACFE04_001661 [Oxalis oulophora]
MSNSDSQPPFMQEVPSETSIFFKTRLCLKFLKGNCVKRDCHYAHGEAEMRQPPTNWREAEMTGSGMKKHCKIFATGKSCRYGQKCRFLHVADPWKNFRESSAITIETNGSRESLAIKIGTNSSSMDHCDQMMKTDHMKTKMGESDSGQCTSRKKFNFVNHGPAGALRPAAVYIEAEPEGITTWE